MKTGLKSILIAGLLAHAALSVHAQTTATPSAANPMPTASGSATHEGHKNHERGMHRRMDPAKMEAKWAQRLAELKAKLQISAAQEGAWTTFTAALKPLARVQHTRPDRAELAKLTTPERIDTMRAHRAQRMTDMQSQMDKREDATKTFYAALNADQKKLFDAEHGKMMQRWGDRKGMGHGSRHEAHGKS